MTKIYVVTEEYREDIDDSSYSVIKAFKNKKDADDFCDRLNLEATDRFSYEVEETILH